MKSIRKQTGKFQGIGKRELWKFRIYFMTESMNKPYHTEAHLYYEQEAKTSFYYLPYIISGPPIGFEAT